MGTASGQACLTLEFVVSDSVRQNAHQRCAGYLNWGLYRGGAVGGLGPNGSSVQGGTVPNVDLSQAGDSYELTLPNIEPRSYQALAYISQHANSSDATSGDPVTLPSGSFNVPADQHTQVKIVLNYVR